MIGFGLIALVIASIQHAIDVRAISGVMTRKRRSLAVLLSMLLAILGGIAFWSALFRE
jgi:putative membrane protein